MDKRYEGSNLIDQISEESKVKLDELFAAFSLVSEGAYIFLCDMNSNISRWSKSAVNFFGLPSEYMLHAGKIWSGYIHPDDREEYQKSIEAIFSGENNGHDMQYRARSKDGNYVVCTCKGIVIRNIHGDPVYFGGAIKNHGLQSYIDVVTGLRSLYGFFEDLKTMFWNTDESVIVQIGISNFSNYNDVYGYSFGNRILQNVARTIEKKFEGLGTVYRMDGTKFAVISHTLSMDELEEQYNELNAILRTGVYLDGMHIVPSLNAGAVKVDDFSISDKTVYSCLKYAYYESKNLKLGDFVAFQNTLNDDNRQKLERISVIRSCITENCRGFFLCYQPVVYADSEKLKAIEALIRWKDDKYGIVPPNEFIGILEQDPLFPQLGRWVLKQAMTDGLVLLEKYPNLIVNVNLSFAQMEKSGFVDEVMNLLLETGFPAENLCLELTERCRLLDMDLLKNMINTFRNAGIKIALDDFGTGYSSLGILRKINADTIKIDREFVKNIEKSFVDQNTVGFLADMSYNFGSELCVEGIENMEMRDIVLRYKVGTLQGYYYSKPVTFEEFCKLEFKH